MSVTGVERLPAARPIDLAQSGGSYGSVNGSKARARCLPGRAVNRGYPTVTQEQTAIRDTPEQPVLAGRSHPTVIIPGIPNGGYLRGCDGSSVTFRDDLGASVHPQGDGMTHSGVMAAELVRSTRLFAGARMLTPPGLASLIFTPGAPASR